MEYLLLGSDVNISNMLIPKNELEKYVDSYNEKSFKIVVNEEVTEELIARLNTVTIPDFSDTLDDLDDSYDETERQENWIKSICIKEGIRNFEVRLTDNLEMFNDSTIIFDGSEFTDIRDFETSELYNYWDGSNQKIVFLEGEEVWKLVVSDESYSLDEYDYKTEGYNSGSRFYHEVVRKIVLIDDETVTEQYLIEQGSQWQRAHDTGLILDRQNLILHLEELERDVIEYMKQIDALN